MANNLQSASAVRLSESIETRKSQFLSRLQNRPEATYNLTVDVNITSYTIWETVTGWTSWATWVVKQIWTYKSFLTLKNVSWEFIGWELITGGTSWTTANSIIN